MKNIKWLILQLTGVLFIITAGTAYLPSMIQYGIHELELTFLSNAIAGVVFLIGGIYGIRNKTDLPQQFYLNSILLLQIVFFVCLAFWREFNFSGFFIFLHVINTIIASIEFLTLITCEKVLDVKPLLTALLIPIIYLIYAITYGCLTGNWIYGILNIENHGIVFVMILILVIACGILFLGWVSIN